MRTWQNNQNDDGSVHALGNGELIAYAQGPDLINLYGPPYSSPNILTLKTEYEGVLRDEIQRDAGTAIRNHHLRGESQTLLDFTEFAAAGESAYLRSFECFTGSGLQSGISWLIRPNPAAEVVSCPTFPGAWLIILRPGQKIFNYPGVLWSYHWLLPIGNCHAERRGGNELAVILEGGSGWLAVVGSNSYPEGVDAVERVLAKGAHQLMAETRRSWSAFTWRRQKENPKLLQSSSEAADAVDSAAVLIKTQQSADGGVMAGHYYALAYIRDQYGTSRGMLSLGMIDEARKNLEFRMNKFQRFGSLKTAETMGSDCARHIHENDDVEGPAYTILQARDYLRSSGDRAFIRSLDPMLEWCWQVQVKQMVRGVLPFNGDETYVAGGFFPRSGLLQGSADTTLAMVTAFEWLVVWNREEKLHNGANAAQKLEAIEQASQAYRRHFFDGEHIWANLPERADWNPQPRTRHGVCQGLCGWFGWTERTPTGWYACPRCLNKTDWQPFTITPPMEVNSVSLLPLYLRSNLLSHKEMWKILDRILAQQINPVGLKENCLGHIPSVPGTLGCVGYDPGLLLLNLLAVGHPAAEKAYWRVLTLLDSAGGWVEYYDETDHTRQGCCRCRPWETGINAEAMVNYLSTIKPAERR